MKLPHEQIMPLTDDDLKRLKELSKNRALSGLEKDINALLARLEAAEAALEIYEDHFMGYDDDAMAAVKDWRKAAGKDKS